MRHIIPISGKDSCATAIIQTTRYPDNDYEYMFNPTGLELPEVFKWINKVGDYLGKPITQVGRDLNDIIVNEYNYFLPSPTARYCTKLAKIQPMLKWLGKDECNVYYGIRADEQREGFNNTSSPNIVPKYPLIDANINLQGVYIIVNAVGLKPPTFFWKSVYDMVGDQILDYDINSLPEWIFDMLFSWRSRTNCDRCFNQRYYEWVGLLEHYPDRFWDAETYEHKGSKGIYTWSSNQKSLKEIAEQSDQIKQKRVNQIIKSIKKYRQQSLFQDDSGTEIFDVLSIKSCGLFCGK